MVHKCAACKCEAEKPAGNDQSPATEPHGWFKRCIDAKDYVLCDVCGHQSHFRGGISPYLKDTLELDEWATCDLSAEAAALGIERRRFRKTS